MKHIGMKRVRLRPIAIAIAALASLGACAVQAQQAASNVTLYGVFDMAMRYTTNVNAAGDHRFSVDPGLIQGSRWGVRGTEDLGAGMKALFNLESGFAPDTGAFAQQGQVFGRQAWVGLGSDFGTITAGRQFGVGFDTLGAFDPYGVGNHGAISWHLDLIGARFDNTVKYRGSVGPWSASAAYSFGEQSGSLRRGQTAGLGVGYAAGAYTFNAAAQRSSDVNLAVSRAWLAGGTAQLGATKVFAGYVNNHRDRGFAPCASNNATSLGSAPPACQLPSATANPFGINGPLSNTGLRAGSSLGEAKTQLFMLGATLQATDLVTFTGGLLREKNHVEAPGTTDGQRTTLYGVADYYFSKRTDVYASVDHDRRSGGYAGAYSGHDSQTGVMLGLRHRF
jgi:predicted porin